MKRVILLMAALALLGGVGQVRANLIVNGGFETPVPPNGRNVTLFAGDSSMGPWVILAGSVDVLTNNYWPAYEGSNSIDLSGLSSGTISQTFNTTPGIAYTLTFAYANNSDNGFALYSGQVSVVGAGTLLDTTVTHTGSTHTNMNYQLFSQVFTADSSSATLQFQDTSNNGGAGMVLDDVSVEPMSTPEPTTLTLLGLGTLGLLGYARRHRKRVPALV